MDGFDEKERTVGAVCLAPAGTGSMMDAVIVNQYAPNQPKAWESDNRKPVVVRAAPERYEAWARAAGHKKISTATYRQR